TAEGIETNREVESSTPDAMGSVLFQYGLRGEASQYLTRYSLEKIEGLDAKALAEEAKAIFAKYGASL
ncbi:MAG TPA: hypothetical protein DCE41_36310, partial [Cytophagales bacterium]|nr:hypothetical protein [Cytophagales bacterium]